MLSVRHSPLLIIRGRAAGSSRLPLLFKPQRRPNLATCSAPYQQQQVVLDPAGLSGCRPQPAVSLCERVSPNGLPIGGRIKSPRATGFARP